MGLDIFDLLKLGTIGATWPALEYKDITESLESYKIILKCCLTQLSCFLFAYPSHY
jgi:hypothetical protein